MPTPIAFLSIIKMIYLIWPTKYTDEHSDDEGLWYTSNNFGYSRF